MITTLPMRTFIPMDRPGGTQTCERRPVGVGAPGRFATAFALAYFDGKRMLMRSSERKVVCMADNKHRKPDYRVTLPVRGLVAQTWRGVDKRRGYHFSTLLCQSRSSPATSWYSCYPRKGRPIEPNFTPSGIAVSPDGSYALVTNYEAPRTHILRW
jgi:hypothetical protein